MKRKLLMTTLMLTLAVCSIFGLTACGGNNDNGNNIGGANSTIAVTSVTLNRSSVNLKIGDTVSLYKTIYPSNASDKSVTWNSSNTSVATVSNGTVTAKSEGSTTITVRTSNNKTATCYVTVNPKNIAVTSVELNKSSATIEVGNTLNLTATIYPNNATDKSITWNSSNTSVATVSNGTVTAKSEGSTTITVRTSNNKTATCYVTVNPINIAVTSVTLNKSSATIEVGDTLNLTATIYPSNATDKSITWNSSNTSVATVSNGTITAKSVGTATITVKTSNNKTATCYVTVNPRTIAVTSVSLNKTSATLEVGDTLNLTATIYPSNSTDKSVTWSSSNTSVATVSNGIVSAVSTGTAVITVKTNNNMTATCEVTVEEIFVFEEYDTGYALIAYKGSETVVTVPSSYNGKPVLVIGAGKIMNYQYVMDAFSNNSTIKKVVLPDTIRGINHASFTYCSSLEEIVMPKVKNIGAYAFYCCTSINNIDLPSTLENIYPYAFAGCKLLESVDFPINLETIQGNAFSGCTALTNIKFQNTTVTITSNAFNECNLKINIDIPSTPYEFCNWSTGGNAYFPNFVHTTVIINNIEVKIKNLTSDGASVMIYIGGTKTYDYYGTSHKVKFNYKIKDGNTVLASGTITSISVAEGECFVAETSYSISIYIPINELFDSNNNLSLELIEVAW